VAGITGWLLARPEVRRIRACTLTGNVPSRRVLEKAGFSYAGIEDGEAIYQRDAPGS
jgi:RimJ/RimL family protein N-acetyltransferase